jgi:hypothetical protein
MVVAAGNPELTETITAVDTRLSLYHLSARTPERRQMMALNWAAFEGAYERRDGVEGALIVQRMVAESRAELLRQMGASQSDRPPARQRVR